VFEGAADLGDLWMGARVKKIVGNASFNILHRANGKESGACDFFGDGDFLTYIC
jgi:hypothetical protein